jgi:hypothetical protein
MRDQETSPQLRLHARPDFAFLLRERVRMRLEEAGSGEKDELDDRFIVGSSCA